MYIPKDIVHDKYRCGQMLISVLHRVLPNYERVCDHIVLRETLMYLFFILEGKIEYREEVLLRVQLLSMTEQQLKVRVDDARPLAHRLAALYAIRAAIDACMYALQGDPKRAEQSALKATRSLQYCSDSSSVQTVGGDDAETFPS